MTVPRRPLPIHMLVVAFVAIAGLSAVLPGVANAKAKAKTSGWTWRTEGKIAGNSGFDALSCPAVNFCAGVSGGDVWVTRTPAGSVKSWAKSLVDNTTETSENSQGQKNSMFALSCGSAALCVAGDTSQNSITSTNPFGGPAAWTLGELPSGTYVTIERMSCLASGVCVALDVAGDALSTSNAAGGVWTDAALPGSSVSADLYGLSCTPVQCVAVESGRTAWVTKDPADPQPVWTPVHTAASLSSIGCSGSFCVAGVSGSSTLYASSNPSIAGSWKAVKTSLNSFGATSISCVSAHFCAAADGDAVLTSTTPAKSGSWRGSASTKGSGSENLVCPSAKLCIGEHFGTVYIGTDK